MERDENKMAGVREDRFLEPVEKTPGAEGSRGPFSRRMSVEWSFDENVIE